MKAYTDHAFDIYEVEFTRHWDYVKPYFNIIESIEIEEIDQDYLSELKTTFMVKMIETSQFNIKNKKFKNGDEQRFYDRVHLDVMKNHSRNELEKIVSTESSILADKDHPNHKLIGIRTPHEKSKNGPSCKKCKDLHISQPYSIDYIPELPNPSCTKTRCHCFYVNSNPDMDFVISSGEHPEIEKAFFVKIGDEEYTVWDPNEIDLKDSTPPRD